MLTMLLGGLWHGASWRFVVWGGLHGSYLAVERFINGLPFDKSLAKTLPVKIILGLLTYLLVCITWVMFRAGSFEAASQMVKAMLLFKSPPVVMTLSGRDIVMVLGINALMLIVHALMRNTTLEHIAAKIPWFLKVSLLVLMLFAILTAPGERNAFIYFQF
jgi:D-alanyl-lipoteichoic acid acyltransferase DltB (MBOAT superfamily)